MHLHRMHGTNIFFPKKVMPHWEGKPSELGFKKIPAATAAREIHLFIPYGAREGSIPRSGNATCDQVTTSCQRGEGNR